RDEGDEQRDGRDGGYDPRARRTAICGWPRYVHTNPSRGGGRDRIAQAAASDAIPSWMHRRYPMKPEPLRRRLSSAPQIASPARACARIENLIISSQHRDEQASLPNCHSPTHVPPFF